MKKFKARKGWAEIEEVEIQRETNQCVFLSNGRKTSKMSDWECYFDTWEEAHNCLLRHAEQKLSIARRFLQNEQDYYGNVKGMKKPCP